MSAFITLPSGCRISSTDIIQYAQHFQQPDKLWIEVRSSVEGENEKLENMTAEQLDDLLNPPTAAIVSPVLDLDNLRPGKSCQFTYEGQVKHGVIEDIENGSFEPNVYVISDGVRHFIMPRSGITEAV